MLPFEIPMPFLASLAAGFVLLGVFYPSIASLLGLDEGYPEQRMLSILLGLAIAALLVIYRIAEQSLAV